MIDRKEEFAKKQFADKLRKLREIYGEKEVCRIQLA
jgi:hypothetical protein